MGQLTALVKNDKNDGRALAALESLWRGKQPKGEQLKDDANWAALGIRQGQKLMLMGTADVPAAPPEKV